MRIVVPLIFLLLYIVACNQKETPVVKPVPTPVVSVPAPTSNLRSDIFKIVDTSACAEYQWKGRTRAPQSYVRGIALMYAKQVCGQGSDFIKKEHISGSNSIGLYKDALYYYGIDGSQLNTYTLLIGLGMRESSGKYCVGRDRSASFTSSQDAEAGLFQMAYIARVFNSELEPLYKKYKSGELPCELEVFSGGVSCSKYDAQVFGTGEGAAWQKLMKVCPAASTQWAAILIRSQYRHFGPLIRKEAEYLPQCRGMLQAVEKAVNGRCKEL